MPDFDGLLRRYSSIWGKVSEVASSGKKILVVTHIDADGLTSGSIVFSALVRAGANVSVRCLPDLDPKRIADLAGQSQDYYVFTDLASTLLSDLEEAFGDRFLIIDHHQLSDQDAAKPTVVNAWTYGFDGGREACSAAMAYFFAEASSKANADLAPLAVIGAVADRQDQGPDRSLSGLNRMALERAQSSGLVLASRDLLFTGRETRPVHEAVALTSTPYLPGITGSKDKVLALLHQCGLKLKEGGSWRTISSLDQQEKGILTEAIAGVLASAEGATDAIAGLVGDVYTLALEDEFTPLRDAREFGTLLNACGRMGLTGIGVEICLGERSGDLDRAISRLSEYRASLGKAIDAILGNPSRAQYQGNLVLMRAEGLVEEQLLGPVTSILTSSQAYRDKVVVAITQSGDSQLKVSSRVGDLYPGDVNLGLIMREAAEAANGVGGGHTMAAGARIPAERVDTFTDRIRERFSS